MKKSLLSILFATNCLIVLAQADTINMMFYNLLQFPGSTGNRITHLRTIMQETQPDILMVCELQNNTGSVTILTQALNTGGVSRYQRAAFFENGYLNNMMYYDYRKFQMHKQDTIHSRPRFATVYQLLHKAALEKGDSTILHLIVVHLKAGDDGSSATDRAKTSKRIRHYIDKKTDGKNIFLAGDLNVYTPKEEAFKTLTERGTYRLNDPVNEIGEWQDNFYYAPLHTQSTRTTSFGGGSTGGLDDRFDWILISDDVKDGSNGVSYLSRTYKSFGNDGKHLNQAINFGSNSAARPEIIDALHEMSDHLPVELQLSIDVKNTSIAQTQKLNFEVELNREFIKINRNPNYQTENGAVPQINCYDLSGRHLGSVKGFQTPLSELGITTNGMYMVRIQYGKQFKFLKVMF